MATWREQDDKKLLLEFVEWLRTYPDDLQGLPEDIERFLAERKQKAEAYWKKRMEESNEQA